MSFLGLFGRGLLSDAAREGEEEVEGGMPGGGEGGREGGGMSR